MDISSLAINKGLLVKGFASLSGILGASSASWYFYDSINQTGYSKFFKSGYKFAPTVFYSDVTSLDFSKQEHYEVDRFNTKRNICVEKYIPADVFGTDFFKSYDSTSTSASDLGYYSSTSLNSAGSNITGCIAMKLSTNGGNFVFESETVVKNDKYALIIWSSSWNFRDISLENKVIFLEKQNNSWSVKGGFVLIANGLSKVEIKSPDSSISSEFSSKTDATTTSGSWSYKYYFGIWEENSSGSTFANLISWAGQSDTNYDSGLDYKLPTTQSRAVYNTSNSKWQKQDENVQPKLKNWFDLFKDKKGKWKKIDDNLIDDCKEKSLIRNIDEKTEKFLEKYCFRPSGK